MPVTYEFRDSKISDSVSKALMFMSRFSRKQAIVRFSDTSVSIVWSRHSMYIHSEITGPDMFKDKLKLRPLQLSDSIIEADPSKFGRSLKGCSQGRSVTVAIYLPDKVKIIVGSEDTNKRTIIHSLQCSAKSIHEYKSILMSETEKEGKIKYDIKCYAGNIHRLKHIVETFNRLQSARFWIWARKLEGDLQLTIQTRTQGSNIRVNISDLEDGSCESDDDVNLNSAKTEAGVHIDTKNVALFLSNLLSKDRSRICFSIKHINTLKITHISESMQGEKSYQSILLPHNI